MNNCPPELHSYIIRLACTDDGTTVRALLRVSRYFYTLAVPFLYQSMVLEGRRGIMNVASSLDKIPPHRRKIRHLFISDTPTSKSSMASSAQYMEIDTEVETAMLRILHLATPTLESLTFVSTNMHGSTCLIARLFRLSFPRLRELTVHGFYPFPAIPNTFPILTHLHLSGNRNPHGLLQLGALEAACPRLSHLWISGVYGAVAFAKELHDALVPCPLTLRNSPIIQTKPPDSLKVVVVQPAPNPLTPAKCGTMRRKALMMMDRLKDTAGRAGKTALRLVDSRPAGPSALKVDWVDRLEGRSSWAE